MKRKISALLCLSLSLLLLVSCGSGEEGVRYDYDLSRYIEVGQFENFRVPFEDPTVCTEQEIDHAQTQVLLSYAEFEEKGEGAEVERYNKVEISYRMYLKGEELEDYTEDSYFIIVGSEGFGDLDFAMGEALLGAKPGEIREAEYTFPDDDRNAEGWAGLTVTMKGEVKRIYSHVLPELTDEFVGGLEGEGGSFLTVEEFRKALKASLLEQKEAARENAVFTAYMNSVTVKEYPKKEVEAYVEELWQSTVATAEEMGMDVAAYLGTYLSTDEKSHREELEEKARDKVKGEMACIQLSRLRGTTLSEEEYREGVARLFAAEQENAGFADLAEFEAYYTKRELREGLLWEKSFQALVEEAESTI